MAYGTDSNAETTKTNQLIGITEMSTIRMDKIGSQEEREQCFINDVVKFRKKRRKEWHRSKTSSRGQFFKPSTKKSQNDHQSGGGKKIGDSQSR